MKKLIGIAIILIIQQLAFNTQYLFAQVPNDNIGSGNCLEFDGVSDYVIIPDDNSLDLTSNVTLESWVYYNAFTTGPFIVSKPISGNSNELYKVNVGPAGKVYFTINGNTISSPSALSLSTWYHIATVYDGSTQKIYINGVLDVTNSLVTTIPTNSLPVYIGVDIDNGSFNQYMNGKIDEVRVWSTPRSQSQIRDNMCKQLTGSESGLVGYWNMNEGSGNTVSDLTTNANHGTRQ